MKLEYDKDVDAAYIYIEESRKVASTTKVTEDILLDFDNKGRVIGIEVLNAKKKHLTKKTCLKQPTKL